MMHADVLTAHVAGYITKTKSPPSSDMDSTVSLDIGQNIFASLQAKFARSDPFLQDSGATDPLLLSCALSGLTGTSFLRRLLLQRYALFLRWPIFVNLQDLQKKFYRINTSAVLLLTQASSDISITDRGPDL